MGLIKHFSCSYRAVVGSPNPVAHRFIIKKLESVGLYTVASVHYLDCTTYGGDKIMVYYCQPHHIERCAELDPHFIEGKFSPIARFPANDKGWEHAMAFVKMMKGEGDGKTALAD